MKLSTPALCWMFFGTYMSFPRLSGALDSIGFGSLWGKRVLADCSSPPLLIEPVQRLLDLPSYT
jgi:hypothetical protein